MRAGIRVAIDARSLLCRAPRGEGKSLLRLYQELARVRPDIEPVFFGDSSALHYSGGLPGRQAPVRLHAPGLDRVWESVAFPLAARWQRCELMHCTSSGAPKWCGGMPMIMTVHDLIPMVFDDGHTPRERAHFAERLRRGIHQAAQVFTVSQHTKDDLLRCFPQAEAKTAVMHWGAEPPSVPVAPAVAPPHILAFGGEVNRKNTDYTVDRYIAAAGRVPGLHLHLVGLSSAAQRERIHARLSAAGLAPRVTLHPFIAEAELKRLFETATALLYLSLYEGFGVPILEAVSKGVPVIASDRTAIPEVLAGARGCYSLDDPQAIEDAIARMTLEPGFRAAFVEEQARVLARFSWRAIAERLGRSIDDALS